MEQMTFISCIVYTRSVPRVAERMSQDMCWPGMIELIMFAVFY